MAVDRGRVAFSHPLLALAVYRSASTSERRAAHRRLAEVIQDLEERARHLALASSGPNRELAELLDRAAKLRAIVGLRGRRRSWPISGGAPRPVPTSVPEAARDGGGRIPLRGGRRRRRAGARPRAEVGRASGPRACPGLRPPLQLLVERRQRDARAPRSAIAETSEEAELANIHTDLAYIEILGGHLRSGSEHGRRAIELAERADAPVP